MLKRIQCKFRHQNENKPADMFMFIVQIEKQE